MRIIDAHLHFGDKPYFAEAAIAAGHENTAAHLRETFARLGIRLAIAMGSTGLVAEGGPVPVPDLDGEVLPPEIAYCCGVNGELTTRDNLPEMLAAYEAAVADPHCVGLKFYPGYNRIYLGDPRNRPFLELAEAYDLPVVIHTGDTAGSHGVLKYAHPLTIDEVAVDFPRVRFVIAHFGNPWAMDAAEVALKNENVYIDLSGLAQGKFALAAFYEQYRGYLEYLRTWLGYLSRYDKVLYGSDWPLVHLETYIELIRQLIPPEHHDAVFFANACRVFPKIMDLPALRQ